MTSFDTNRSAVSAAGISSYISSFAGIFGTLAAWNDARVTRKSLSRLTARELDDIGLSRGDIDMIAARGSR